MVEWRQVLVGGRSVEDLKLDDCRGMSVQQWKGMR